MKPLFADFNNMSESGLLRLNCIGSQQDLVAAGLHPGDWAWFSDCELIVGGKIDRHERDRDVAMLDWKTLVHLDDPWDWRAVLLETNALLSRPNLSEDENWRLFELFTVFERIAPKEAFEAIPDGFFPFCRAVVLVELGRFDLALVELRDVRRLNRGAFDTDYLYLEILGITDLPAAVREVAAIIVNPDLGARALAACVHILGAHVISVDRQRFAAEASAVLALADLFDQANTREPVSRAILAKVQFTRGLILLRLGHLEEARSVLDAASEGNPDFDAVRRLTSYDQDAREIAARTSEALLKSEARAIAQDLGALPYAA